MVFSTSMSKLNDLESTEGEIIGRKVCSGSGSQTYGAVIQYYDEINRATYVFTASICSNPGPTVGNTITVLYDPEAPGEAYDGSFISLWLIPFITISLGLVFCVPFVLLACKTRKAFLESPESSNNTIEQADPSSSAHVDNNTIEQVNPPVSVPIYTAHVVETK